MNMGHQGRVLVAAGSDPSGGAGIQADIKTITTLGGYAAAAITALTVQNTVSVSDVMPVPVDFVTAQMAAVLADIGADSIKTGMLYSAACVDAVIGVIKDHSFHGALVVDPVMVATSGDPLLQSDAVEYLKKHLIPITTVLTPNMAEATILTGQDMHNLESMTRAGKLLIDMGARAVVMKGGHMGGNMLTDILISEGQEAVILTCPKIETRHTHGTGCTFASALAVFLAQGQELKEAFKGAHAYVRRAIEYAPGFGAGCGPLGHAAAGKV